MALEGHDSRGRNFASPDELWQAEADQDGGHETWYQQAVSYWDQQDASYDGVLGGYGHVSDVDVRDSRQLLLKAFKAPLEAADKSGRRLVALDCGAGVGRVTKELLLHHFQEVDLLEPSQHLLDEARKILSAPPTRGSRRSTGKAVNFYCAGLQQHEFTPGRYDVIWIQWCLLYLTDVDAISLFHRCPAGIKPDGIIVVKENICREGFVVDKADSSLTRSNQYMLELFEKAGMQVLYNIKQRNFPKELFEVRMYVLRPRQQQQAPSGLAGVGPQTAADAALVAPPTGQASPADAAQAMDQ